MLFVNEGRRFATATFICNAMVPCTVLRNEIEQEQMRTYIVDVTLSA
jgi:hypothetical protein